MVRREGTLATVAFSGEVKGVLTTDDLAQQVSQSLQWAGYSVRSISVSTPVWTNVITGAWLHYAYTAVVVFQLGWDADDTELTNAVTNAVLAATGLTPTGFEVRGTTNEEEHPTGTPVSGVFDTIGSTLQQIGWGVLVLIALLVALLVFRPDIGRLAAA